MVKADSPTQNDPPPAEEELAATPATPPPTDKNFFEDFSHNKKKRPFSKLLLIPLALIIVIGGYLLKPTIESFFKPTAPEVYSPVSQEPKSMHLEINNPADQIMVSKNTLVVSGQTSPKAGIVINVQYQTGKEGNFGIEASELGDFSRTIDLQLGVNEIIINAFDTQGNNKTETREVYYTEEKI